jgi:hypothetical protein
MMQLATRVNPNLNPREACCPHLCTCSIRLGWRRTCQWGNRASDEVNFVSVGHLVPAIVRNIVKAHRIIQLQLVSCLFVVLDIGCNLTRTIHFFTPGSSGSVLTLVSVVLINVIACITNDPEYWDREGNDCRYNRSTINGALQILARGRATTTTENSSGHDLTVCNHRNRGLV